MVSYVFSDSETTDDEGGQYETKEDGGEFEDQNVHRGTHHVASITFFPQRIIVFPS